MKNAWVTIILVGVILNVCAGVIGGLIGIPWVRTLLFGLAGGLLAIFMMKKVATKNEASNKKDNQS